MQTFSFFAPSVVETRGPRCHAKWWQAAPSPITGSHPPWLTWRGRRTTNTAIRKGLLVGGRRRSPSSAAGVVTWKPHVLGLERRGRRAAIGHDCEASSRLGPFQLSIPPFALSISSRTCTPPIYTTTASDAWLGLRYRSGKFTVLARSA